MKVKLKTKDFILIGVFSVLIYVVNAVVGFALMPVMATSAMPLTSGVCLFFSAVVYLIMAIKIGKKGGLFLLSIVTGLIYTIMGVPLMLLFFAAAGLLGEAVLIPGDGSQYRRLSRQAIAYAVYGALFGVGGYVTIYVYGSDYLESVYSADIRDRMLYFAYSPAWMTASIVFSFGMSLLGSLFAAKLLNRHFVKAGMLRKAG
ncbi:MptD family putative ECF transporter S component [Paenibacillus senegalensis]|uniref:MptD family putative ECF transporter S component n=1 Tax=Paenibacillus senegalensis TaxID=1465766 RepID=UPI000289E5E2|nr:MptD family putative ECF transporter S component [Paenibacillus senegalensis]